MTEGGITEAGRRSFQWCGMRRRSGGLEPGAGAIQTRSWRGRGAARSGSGSPARLPVAVPVNYSSADARRQACGYLVGAAVDVDAKRGRRANFAADGAGGRETRRRRASEAACAAGRHRHFGAEDGVRPATAGPDGGEAACAAGGRRIHAGEAARGRPPSPPRSSGRSGRAIRAAAATGPAQRPPLRLPLPVAGRSRLPVCARRQRRARQPPSAVRRASPLPSPPRGPPRRPPE